MNKHRLLFVDDEDNLLKSLERLFQDDGYEIFTACNGVEGMQLVSKYEFSLILSDFRMPELDGVEFLKKVREKSPDTIRMILTGFADIDIAVSAINDGGVYKFIEKPWEEGNLRVQIKRALEYFELVSERKGLLDRIQKQNEELRDWNSNLERKVREKTVELQEAYEQLQIKVKELEGRDKVLKYLLAANTFEDTLDLILGVILDIVVFDKVLIYSVDSRRKTMYPKAGSGVKNSQRVKMSDDLIIYPPLPVSKVERDRNLVPAGEYYGEKIDEYTFGVPIIKDADYLGIILIDNSETKRSIMQDELKIISSFASLTALAINDYLITSEAPDLQKKIGKILEQ